MPRVVSATLSEVSPTPIPPQVKDEKAYVLRMACHLFIDSQRLETRPREFLERQEGAPDLRQLSPRPAPSSWRRVVFHAVPPKPETFGWWKLIQFLRPVWA